MIRIALPGALALAGLCAAVADGGSSRAAGASPPNLCVAVEVAEGDIARHDGRWIWLTGDQRLFLAGIYAMNPATPPGLPFGDRAAMATAPNSDGGVIFFVDGDRACTPMAAPKALLDLLRDVATGVVHHEGTDN